MWWDFSSFYGAGREKSLDIGSLNRYIQSINTEQGIWIMENLTAKNIQKCQTHDGYAWAASFYLDGKKIGMAMDQGHGGEVDTMGLDSTALAKIEAYAKTLPHFGTEHGMDIEQTAAMVLEECVFDTLDQRKSSRELKNKLIGRLPDGVYTWKIPKGRTMDDVKIAVVKKYPAVEILNDMPFADAHKILSGK